MAHLTPSALYASIRVHLNTELGQMQVETEKAVIVIRGMGGELDRAVLEIEECSGGDFTGAVREFLRSQVLRPGDVITLEAWEG